MNSTKKTSPEIEEFESLNMTCTSTDCEHDLHCFLPKNRKQTGCFGGPCRKCEMELVDFERIRELAPNDIPYLFEMLQLERIRHGYWTRSIDPWARNFALRLGRHGVRSSAEQRIASSISRPPDAYACRRTSKSGNLIHYAQHATATCCRVCVAEWYRIPMNRPLSDNEAEFFANLVTRYINIRMPELPDCGQHVPPIRSPVRWHLGDGLLFR